MLSDQKDTLDFSLCQECGGRCCQGSPGIWVDPERFFGLFFPGQRLTLEQLRGELPALGLVLWEKTGVPMPAPRSVASGCSFHGATGCSLPLAQRPCQCLALIPIKQTVEQAQGCLCRLPEAYSMHVAKRRWQQYWRTV